jgi:hypothetical protein
MKALNRLFLTLVLAGIPTILLAALPAMEACGGGFPSADWTDTNPVNAPLGNSTGFCYNTVANWGSAFWNADVFSDDQYATVEWSVTDPTYGGPAVRMSGTDPSRNGYVLFADTTTYYLRKWVAGTESGDLQTWSQACCTIGDDTRLEIVGTTLTAYHNGTPLAPTVTDSDLASGSAGMFLYGNSSRPESWEGGNIGGGPAPPTCRGAMLLRMIGC